MAYVYNAQLDAFTLYHISHEDSSKRDAVGPVLPALGHAASGAAGAAISKLLIYPLDLVVTRLQAQKHFRTHAADAEYTGVQDAVAKIYNNEGGVRAFYSGVLPETLKGVADSFLFFLAYTYVRQSRATAKGSRNLSILDEIGVGVVAGAFSKFWTTPMQNIVTRKQTAAMAAARDPESSVSPDLSVKDIALQIRDEKGWQGFWSGYSASLILTLNPSITMLLHKILLRLLVPAGRRSDPGARLTFLLAAISKALASTFTYPFSLAKTRAQVSSRSPTEVSEKTDPSDQPAEAIKTTAIRARKQTVFSTILQVLKAEGFSALYEGLGAEVLKGFFSHGITMLMKDRIHAVIINLYYLVLQALKKYPSPEELAKSASEQAKLALEEGKEQINTVYAKGVEATGKVSASVRNTASSAKTKAEDLTEKSKTAIGNSAQQLEDKLVQADVKDIEGGAKGDES